MYIRNAWYVVAWSDEIGRAPLNRTVLGEDVVLYRREDGTAVALADRCAHRAYPLSAGQLVGDNIQCGYHGFEYGRTGGCGSGWATPRRRRQHRSPTRTG